MLSKVYQIKRNRINMKIIAIFTALILLMGIIPSASYIVNAQKDVNIIMPQSTGVTNQQPIIDLNEQEKTTLANLLLECPDGLFVYNGINGQIVIACLINGAYAKLFNSLGIEIDIDVKTSSSGNSNDDDDDDDRDHDKKNCGDRGNFTKSVWEKYCNNNGNQPDEDCLFDPSLPKCASNNGDCPDGFFNNESDQCVPDHREGCPDGYHSVDDDETGKCIKDSEGCPEGMEFREDGKTCTYIEEEQTTEEQQPTETELVPLVTTEEEQPQEENNNNDNEDSNSSEEDVEESMEDSGIDFSFDEGNDNNESEN